MFLLFAIGGAFVGLTAFAASRREQPQANRGTEAPPQQQPVQPRPVAAQETQLPPPKKSEETEFDAGGAIMSAAGVAGGLLARESAFTQEAKDLSIPVGIGVAAAAYLATNVGGAAIIGATGVAVAGSAAAAYLIAPIVLVTTSIITIVDAIMRTVKVGEWKVFAGKVRGLREAGQFREALVLYAQGVGRFEPITRVWPQPGEDWYNFADPLGRPYPGFPLAPSPATAREVERWPEIVPLEVFTDDGKSIPVRGLFVALREDIDKTRAWGLANKAPGTIVRDGKKVTVTEGERSLVGWKPYDDARKNLNDWADAISVATPWLQRGALTMYTPTPAEKAVQTVELAIKAETAAKKVSTGIALTARRLGTTTAAIEAERAETAATQTTAARATARAGGEVGDADTSDTRTGGRTATNNSGSGGRNG